MALSLTLLKDICPSSFLSIVKVRCVRICSERLNDSQDDIVGFEFIVHDIEGTKIHVCVPCSLVQKFATRIRERQLLLLKHFFVSSDHLKCRTTDHPYHLLVYPESDVFEVFEFDFPFFMFSLKSFEDIFLMNDVDDISLFDVIGVVVGVGSEGYVDNGKFLEIYLKDEKHNKLCCRLLFDYVDVFLHHFEENKDKNELLIMIIRYCTPIISKGEVHVFTTYCWSEILFNRDLQEIHDFRKRILFDQCIAAEVALMVYGCGERKLSGVKCSRVPVYTIDDLLWLEMLSDLNGQDGDHWVCGTIENIESPVFGWFYMACSFCFNRVDLLKNYFFCDKCNRFEVFATERYMFVVHVTDGKTNASLLLMDDQCAELIGKKASDFVCQDNLVCSNDPVDVVGLEIQNRLKGMVVLFKVQVRNEIDFLRDCPYIVSMVCNIPHIVDRYYVDCVNHEPVKAKFTEEEATDSYSSGDIDKVVESICSMSNALGIIPFDDVGEDHYCDMKRLLDVDGCYVNKKIKLVVGDE